MTDEPKATYWRCQNNECGFFIRRRKKYPHSQPGKRWEDKSRWLIAHGVIEAPNWVKLRCPNCDYYVIVGGSTKEDDNVDTKPISIVESFRNLKKNANS